MTNSQRGLKTPFPSLIGVCVCFALLPACDSGQRGPRTWGRDLSRQVPSPSGRYVLKIEGYSVDYGNNGDRWWHARVVILDSDGRELYRDKDDYATWFPFRFKWTQSERVSLYSGDVGRFVYVEEQGKWTKRKP